MLGTRQCDGADAADGANPSFGKGSRSHVGCPDVGRLTEEYPRESTHERFTTAI